MSLFLLALIAAVANFIFGAAWHMPLFGKKWGEALGMTAPANPDMKPMYGRMAINFVANYVMAFAVFLIFANFGVGSIGQAFVIGAVLLIGLVLPQLVTTNLWNGRPTKHAITLFLISIGYQIINMAIWALLFAWLA
jgi:hypothetical protein